MLELDRIRNVYLKCRRSAGKVIMPRVAPLYRPLLHRTLFIAVTGSCGKTTTKELVAGILGSAMRGRMTPSTLNQPLHVAGTILRTRPFDGYSVHEVGISARGDPAAIQDSLQLVRPRIGVVTNVGDDHISSLGSKEAIARHKGRVVDVLPADGVAVLNADDPLVLAMRARARCRVVTYGCSPEADVRASDVRSRWPDRLAFTVMHEGHAQRVQTQLLGEHWVSCALAAIATAVAAGMTLAAAARALGQLAPFEARMSPHVRDDGVVFVRDDAKAPLWTVPASLDFLAQADAARKVFVVGTLSDYSHHRRALVSVARRASLVADHVIFIGDHAWQTLRTRRFSEKATISAFSSFDAAHEHLCGLLQPGDLVLLKGGRRDRMDRLMAPVANRGPSARAPVPEARAPRPTATALEPPATALELPATGLEPPATERKPRARACGPEAKAPQSPATRPVPPATGPGLRAEGGVLPPVAAAPLAVVGLGNPGSEYTGTRHNVGQAAIDLLAQRLGAAWSRSGDAWMARASRRGVDVFLVKPITMINDTGPRLLPLFEAHRLVPSRSILVHDEVELPVGSIRGRVEGGAGGHRGVRSVLSTFDDHTFRRVKIGIGRPGPGGSMHEHVLSRFGPHEQEAHASALELAVGQVLLFLDELAPSGSGDSGAGRHATQAHGATHGAPAAEAARAQP